MKKERWSNGRVISKSSSSKKKKKTYSTVKIPWLAKIKQRLKQEKAKVKEQKWTNIRGRKEKEQKVEKNKGREEGRNRGKSSIATGGGEGDKKKNNAVFS